ncbi:MAG: hypothetical protein WC657_02480 [Candidatus Paceibacterota bacterium]|jgi:hypothetical protein
MATIRKHKIIASMVLIIAVIIILMFLNPVHYRNLLLMKFQFIRIHNINPAETNFIWQKSYIGGLGSNGNGNCNYVVGELRSFSGPREKVIAQYQKVLNQNHNAGILFMDGDSWPVDSILWDWRGEFLNQNHIERGNYYIIYTAKKFPALLYLGCPSY